MKMIPLSEARANLELYAVLCQDEPVIVTVEGTPTFQLAPLPDDEDFVDRLVEQNPKFRQLLEKRSSERSVSAEAALRQL